MKTATTTTTTKFMRNTSTIQQSLMFNVLPQMEKSIEAGESEKRERNINAIRNKKTKQNQKAY